MQVIFIYKCLWFHYCKETTYVRTAIIQSCAFYFCLCMCISSKTLIIFVFYSFFVFLTVVVVVVVVVEAAACLELVIIANSSWKKLLCVCVEGNLMKPNQRDHWRSPGTPLIIWKELEGAGMCDFSFVFPLAFLYRSSIFFYDCKVTRKGTVKFGCNGRSWLCSIVLFRVV